MTDNQKPTAATNTTGDEATPKPAANAADTPDASTPNVEPGHAGDNPRGSAAWGSAASGGSVVDKRPDR